MLDFIPYQGICVKLRVPLAGMLYVRCDPEVCHVSATCSRTLS
jgi:hypothetical protein